MTIRPIRSVLLVALVSAFIAGACQSTPPTTTPSSAPSQPSGTVPGPTPAGNASTGPDRTVPPASPAPRLAHIAISFEPFATVPGGPLAVTAPDDGTGRLFVAAQDGKIWVVEQDGTVLDEPMLDIGSLISAGGERGLLGIAAHPSFPTDPRVFVSYTNTEGDSMVASAALDPDDPNRLDPGTLTKILFVDQPFANHNGGSVQFGADGKLYLSFGDGGSGGDPQGNGQSLQSLLGKILRIDVDGGAAAGPYVVPPDNPYAGGGGLPEIWHWGLRNPWRMSFDRANGDLWIGDVGQGQFEEIDVGRHDTRNLNFGWNVMEGSHCYSAQTCATDGLTLPVSDYGRDAGCTVIGGYVYRGDRYPFLVGTYLFSDYCTGTIFALDAASDALTAPVVVGAGVGGGISGFGEGADGELYVTRLAGEVLKVVATER
jgi:glucose/arabinose dehydrogenase